MKIIHVLLCCLFCAVFINNTLRFDVNKASATFLPYTKEKPTIVKMGEDAIQVSPWALSDSDGVGSYPFHTHFIAQTLATGFQLSVIREYLLNKRTTLFEDLISRRMAEHSSSLSKFAKSFAEKANAVLKEKNKLSKEELDQGATFVGAFLSVNEKKVPVLKVLQKGDSLVRVFSKKTDPLTQKMSYSLSFGTAEQQHYFNCPYQIRMLDSKQNNKKNFAAFEVSIREHDIVVMGSDGYFDNVSDGLTLFLINYLNFFTDTTEKQLTFIVESYLQVLTDKRAFVFQFVKDKKKLEGEDEWKFCLNNQMSLHKQNHYVPRPNSLFQSRLNKIFDTKARLVLAEDTKINVVKEFLSCPVIEILSINPEDLSDIYFVSNCLKGIISSKLSMTKMEMENSINNYSAASRSKLLAIAAQLSSVNDYFPSRFDIHDWNSNNLSIEFGGKIDDITVIAAMIKQGPENTNIELNEYYDSFKKEQKDLAIDFYANLLHYVKIEKKKTIIINDKLSYKIFPSSFIDFENGQITDKEDPTEETIEDDEDETNNVSQKLRNQTSNSWIFLPKTDKNLAVLENRALEKKNQIKELEKLLII